jgi:serine/threonine-protein kinase
MTIPATACDHELLRRSLDDGLAEREEEALAAHLSVCPRCQRELERLAGQGEDWSRVAEALRQDSAEALKEVDAAGASSHEAVDFAVDFLEPAVEPQSLGRLGDIDVHEVIGRGGMGIVLRGFQAELNRPVAVKVLAPHLATSGAARKRFAREAQAAAVIVHPHVMPILTVNSTGRLPYLVMPYVACESLQQRLDRTGPLEVIDVLRIGLQVARGLAAAHAQGLVHRDIKPANILLERGIDRVMLTDFGLARAVDDASLTRTGMIAGTPQYMSPEQARGEAIDARSDLFSLGSVLYALCTGRPPFRAETSYGILRRVTDDTPRPIREINPQIPEWLTRVITRLLAKQPAERYASAESLADVLEQCLAHVQQPAVAKLPESLRSPNAATWRRRRIAWRATAAIVAIGIATMVWRGEFIDRFFNRTTADPNPMSPVAETQPIVIPTDITWDDGSERQLHELSREIDRLARDSERNWDEPTTFSLEEPRP